MTPKAVPNWVDSLYDSVSGDEVVEDEEAKPADANLPDEFILNIEDDPLLDFESDDGVFPLDDDEFE